jgi:hypothetical protein
VMNGRSLTGTPFPPPRRWGGARHEGRLAPPLVLGTSERTSTNPVGRYTARPRRSSARIARRLSWKSSRCCSSPRRSARPCATPARPRVPTIAVPGADDARHVHRLVPDRVRRAERAGSDASERSTRCRTDPGTGRRRRTGRRCPSADGSPPSRSGASRSTRAPRTPSRACRSWP